LLKNLASLFLILMTSLVLHHIAATLVDQEAKGGAVVVVDVGVAGDAVVEVVGTTL